jgi:uncharacterized membrane protein YecN with MAPEG domain
VLLVGRAWHAIGITDVEEVLSRRRLGMIATFTVLGFAAFGNLVLLAL